MNFFPSRRWWKFLSSANFFKLLATFYPIERILADSILLEGTQPCERGSFWHPASFWIYSGTEVTTVFVGTLFQKTSFFSSSDLAQTADSEIFVFVCLYFSIFVYFLYFCVYFVYLYSYLKRICVFASFSGFTCCSLSSSPHQPAFTGKRRRTALRLTRSLYKWDFNLLDGIFGHIAEFWPCISVYPPRMHGKICISSPLFWP